MNSIGIFYGSSSGCTQSIAESICKLLKEKGCDVSLSDISKTKASEIEKHSNLIFGTSTWGMGDLQDDWDAFLPNFEKVNLQDKTIALFGLGDSESYPDTFVDGMGIIYEAIADKNITVIGKTDKEGYSFDDSRALVEGSFIGLPIDDSNQGNLTGKRVKDWVEKIISDFR